MHHESDLLPVPLTCLSMLKQRLGGEMKTDEEGRECREGVSEEA